MEIPNSPSSTIGLVMNETMVCQFTNRVTSKGIFFGDFPFDFTSPVLMAQIIIIFIFTQITQALLRPLHQTKIIAQIIAGVLVGPSLLTSNVKVWSTLFPAGGKVILDTFADFGFMLHLFVLGVQTDVTLLKNVGKKHAFIAFASLVLPVAMGGLAHRIILLFVNFGPHAAAPGLTLSLFDTAMTSFMVTAGVLNELNILNSEVGRFAAYTSIVCDVSGWIMSALNSNISRAFAYDSFSAEPLLGFFVVIVYYCTLLFVLRPMVIQMVKNTPEGKPLKDTHFFVIICIVLSAGFFGEVLGQHAGMGTFLFGLSLPDGPPIGSSLVQKLDTVASGLLLPIFCTISGLRTNIFELVQSPGAWLVVTEFLHVIVYLTKIVSIVGASLYFDIPFYDALVLALIMSCKGIVDIGKGGARILPRAKARSQMWLAPPLDIGVFVVWLDAKAVDEKLFTILVFNLVIVTGIATPLVAYLYDPSRRYMGYQRRTILDETKKKKDLHILVCIYNEDNVPPIINLLEASNPTRASPIYVSVLQLKENIGRATSMLVPLNHRRKGGAKHDVNHSEKVLNAFKYFERDSQENVSVQHFGAIAPYSSMHDDICTVALEQNTSIAILPFHKKWAIDGSVDDSSTTIRSVNQNVLGRCPCSIGVLIDRGQIGGNQPVLISQSEYRIAMLCLGGTDDQEALAYSRRMADHPNVTLRVVWITEWGKKNNLTDREGCLMDNFKASALGNPRISCKEEKVRDGVETTKIIRSMEEKYDLFVVGKNQDPDSAVTSGLTDWSECPELGIIGDMLATSDYQFSVLVVQQPHGTNLLPRNYFRPVIAC